MKKIMLLLLFCLSLAQICMAAENVEAPTDCKHCGMNRTAFARGRMIVTYADGGIVGTCSLNCMVTDLKGSNGKAIRSLQVADYNTRKLTDAKKAIWVIGGKKQGIMTSVAKWAFAKKQDAETFIKENGGKLASYDDVFKATEKELSADMQHEGHSGHKM